MSHQYTALGSHIFMGGFSLGMQTAFDVVGHFEHGRFGVDTARANFSGMPIYTDYDTWPIEQYEGVDVVYGNPPCSPWSICGSSLTKGADNWKSDKNFAGTYMTRSLLRRMRPKVWVAESVCLILSRGQEYINSLVHEAWQLGYAVTLFQLDSKLWGLPQQRRRVFVIVHRVDIPLDLWQASRPPCVMATVEQAFTEVDDPGPSKPMPAAYAEMLPRLGQGKWLARLWEEEHGVKRGQGLGTGARLAGRPRFETHRLRADRPSDSMTGGGDAFIHPTEDRFLGVNELARLCGYPTTFAFPQSVDRAAKELGKGVTVTAATVLAQVLRQALDRNERVQRGSVTQVDFRAVTARLDCYEPVNLITRYYEEQTIVLPRRTTASPAV